MQVDIRKYFTPAEVASHLEALPELKTPIIDLVYSTRPTHPLPVLGIDKLADVVNNVPAALFACCTALLEFLRWTILK